MSIFGFCGTQIAAIVDQGELGRRQLKDVTKVHHARTDTLSIRVILPLKEIIIHNEIE